MAGEGAPEDEANGDAPTAAELRLPKNLSPLWYGYLSLISIKQEYALVSHITEKFFLFLQSIN